MSATIRDVAKLAGVSASTVSRVINKSAPISGETTERIYRAMEELKYVPNDIARSFASGSARAIAIAVNVSDTRSYANRFFNNTVFGIETAAHRKGYNFIITSANDERGAFRRDPPARAPAVAEPAPPTVGRVFAESEMRPRARSTPITVTCRRSPAFTTLAGSET